MILSLPRNLELFSDSIDSIIAFLRYSMPTPNGITYVFLDEIQYLKDFSKTVKLFTDHYHEEFKLVMTGSSALMIKHQFRESLVGRKDVFCPLSPQFRRVLSLPGSRQKSATELEQGCVLQK
ncbi:MAG: AAA family ATPase [Candidatus Cloacimonetes bacterium]|nr:AAA family ATPase [Candidatus Cloacimonadota bacterium]